MYAKCMPQKSNVFHISDVDEDLIKQIYFVVMFQFDCIWCSKACIKVLNTFLSLGFLFVKSIIFAFFAQFRQPNHNFMCCEEPLDIVQI